MSTLTERWCAARAAGDLSALDATPYARLIGVVAEQDADGALVARMPFAPHLVGNPFLPALHGGATGALLESTAMIELCWTSELTKIPRIVNFTIVYLRSGKAQDTFARATVVKLGRRVAVLHMVAWQNDADRPIATARAQFLVD